MKIVFASPVQSGFLPPKRATIDHNRSRTDPDIAGTEPDPRCPSDQEMPFCPFIWEATILSLTSINSPFISVEAILSFHIVFTGSVLWTEKIHRTELNQTMVQSIFRLWLPKFGVILVASCLISKIIQNCSKTGWNQLPLVKRSRALHSLVMTFITFNLIFGSSKTVKNWERYNEIHFGINTFFVQLVPEWL